jgi:hypothetical protein
MEDVKLVPVLNALFSRCIVLECQILALRQTLSKKGLMDDEALEVMISKCVDAQADLLAQKDPSQLAVELLRKFEGPPQ